MIDRIQWPDNKTFAFSIFDDTDFATLENVAEVYTLLADLDMLTTKSVWPSRGTDEPICGGDTCEESKYVDWLLRLQERGFEIAYHMNTYHTSSRHETETGLKRFKELFGRPPRAMANHAGCGENMYWGQERVSGVGRLSYNLLTRFRNLHKYTGHVEDSPLFWGDLCRANIQYCRNFVFPQINTLAACPFMPYHDPCRPYVNYWFVSSEGPKVESFSRCLTEAAQDALEEEGGACIMYTHLACGFQHGKSLDRRFRSLMERLRKKNGWFVPVGTLLDYLLSVNGHHDITGSERRQLEWKWLLAKLRTGTS